MPSEEWSRPQVLPLDLGADRAQRGISPLEALASRPGWWPAVESNHVLQLFGRAL